MRQPIIIAVVVIIAVVLNASAFVVTEVEQAIITQFGEPIGGAITEPGLHWKVPFVQKVTRFDRRWLEWDGEAAKMPTSEKTYIFVDTFARWRIVDPLKFFQSVRNEREAQKKLDGIIDSETRSVIAANPLIEVVRSSNREFVEGETNDEGAVPLANRGTAAVNQKVQQGRQKLTRLILEKAQKVMPDYGIELVDIQFQRVNYTQSVQAKVFDRMIQDRKSIAAAYRSEGEGEAARIRGDRERELLSIESEAYRKVQKIKGDADAEATRVYADAFNRDPKLYELVRSLESYRTSFDEDTWLVLSSDSNYLDMLTE